MGAKAPGPLGINNYSLLAYFDESDGMVHTTPRCVAIGCRIARSHIPLMFRPMLPAMRCNMCAVVVR